MPRSLSDYSVIKEILLIVKLKKWPIDLFVHTVFIYYLFNINTNKI